MEQVLILSALTPPPAEGGQPSLWVQLLPFLMIIAVFYFLVFAPMRKKQKRHTDMLSALKAGDKVVTGGGILGTVVGVTDRVIQLRIADQTKVDVVRSAIAGLQEAEE